MADAHLALAERQAALWERSEALEREEHVLAERIAQLESERSAAENPVGESIQLAERQLVELIEREQALGHDIAELARREAEWNQRREQWEQENAAVRAAWDARATQVEDEWTTRQAQLDQKLAELHATGARLAEERAAWQAERQDVGTAAEQHSADAVAEREALERQWQELSAQRESLDAERQTFAAEREAFDVERQTLSARLESLDAERQTLAADREAYERERGGAGL